MASIAEQAGRKVDKRHGDDDKVQPAPRVGEVGHAAHGQHLEARLQEEDDRQDPVQVVERVHEERPGLEPHVLQRHDEAAEQDEGEDHRLKVFVLNQPEMTKQNVCKKYLELCNACELS